MAETALGILSVVVGLLLIAAGALFGLNALSVDSAAETIMHQIYSALNWLIASVLVSGGGILARLGTMSLSVTVTPPAPTNQGLSILEDLAADVAWFKDLKVKEITRAKSIAEQQRKPRA